jgi:hypothetical protein
MGSVMTFGRAGVRHSESARRAALALLVAAATPLRAAGQCVDHGFRAGSALPRLASESWWLWGEAVCLATLALYFFIANTPRERLKRYMRGEELAGPVENLAIYGDLFDPIMNLCRALGPGAYWVLKYGIESERDVEAPESLLARLIVLRTPVEVQQEGPDGEVVSVMEVPDQRPELDRAIAALKQLKRDNAPRRVGQTYREQPPVPGTFGNSPFGYVAALAVIGAVALPVYVTAGLTLFEIHDVGLHAFGLFVGGYLRQNRRRFLRPEMPPSAKKAFSALLSVCLAASIGYSALPRNTVRRWRESLGEARIEQLMSDDIAPILTDVAEGQEIPQAQQENAMDDACALGSAAVAESLNRFVAVYRKNERAYTALARVPTFESLIQGPTLIKIRPAQSAAYSELEGALRAVDASLRPLGYALVVGFEANRNIMAIAGRVTNTEHLRNVDGTPLHVMTFEPISMGGTNPRELLAGLSSERDVFLLTPQILGLYGQIRQRSTAPTSSVDLLYAVDGGASEEAVAATVRIHELRHAVDRATPGLANTETSARLAEVALGKIPHASVAGMIEGATHGSTDDEYARQLRRGLFALETVAHVPHADDFGPLCAAARAMSDRDLARLARRAYAELYPGVELAAGPLRTSALSGGGFAVVIGGRAGRMRRRGLARTASVWRPFD